MSNVLFITAKNDMFKDATMPGMHPSMQRLYEVAAALNPPISGQSAVGRALEKQLPQTMNNWESRGISWKGLVIAQKALGVNAVWLHDGTGPRYAFPSADSVRMETAVDALTRAVAGLAAPERRALADDFALLIQAPDSAAVRARVLAALDSPPSGLTETTDFAGKPAKTHAS